MKNKFLGYILVVMLMLTTNIFGMAFAKDNPVLFIFNEKYGLLKGNLFFSEDLINGNKISKLHLK